MTNFPICYQLVGVPGSGKTTWVEHQDWCKDCVYISTDKYVEEYALKENKTYSEVFEKYMPTAVELMIKDVVDARSKNLDIIWDQTSTTALSRKKKFNMLPNYYHIAIVFKTPDFNELKKRLSSRPGKILPLEVVKSMINNFENPLKDEGFREIWYTN